MDDWIDELETSSRLYLDNIVAALIILIVGWIVAAVVSAIVRGIFKRTSLDERLAARMGADRQTQLSIGEWIAKGVFWLIMLFVLASFFRTLNIPAISGPLDRALTTLTDFIPRLLGAGVLLLIAYVLARVLRALTVRGLQAARVDDRVNRQLQPVAETQGGAGGTGQPGEMPPPVQRPGNGGGTVQGTARPAGGRRVSLAESLGEVVFWLVLLFFLPGILSALDMPGLLAPVQAVVDEVLSMIPNIVAAGLILVVGWFVARIVQRIVTGLLSAAGVDRLAERVGVQNVLGNQQVSGLLGLLVYVLILIPVVIAALEALNLETISAPASNMLNAVLGAIPNIFAAALVLIIAYFIGRLVGNLVAGLLAGFGFDNILDRLGFSQQANPTDRTPSQIVGYVVLVATMLFAATEAAELLGFGLLADIVRDFTVFAGNVLLGLIILAIGLYLANLAARLVRDSGVEQAGLLATAARVAILVLAAAMALRQMGLAPDIINLAFGLLLGAVAVAAAIAFGMGGREIAGRELQRFVDRRRGPQLATPSDLAQGTTPPAGAPPPSAPGT